MVVQGLRLCTFTVRDLGLILSDQKLKKNFLTFILFILPEKISQHFLQSTSTNNIFPYSKKSDLLDHFPFQDQDRKAERLLCIP